MCADTASRKSPQGRSLEIDEIRLIADLRILHEQVNTLHNTINMLRRYHPAETIERYAEHRMLMENIEKIDQIYLWVVQLKEKLNHKALKNPGPDLDSHLNRG